MERTLFRFKVFLFAGIRKTGTNQLVCSCFGATYTTLVELLIEF